MTRNAKAREEETFDDLIQTNLLLFLDFNARHPVLICKK